VSPRILFLIPLLLVVATAAAAFYVSQGSGYPGKLSYDPTTVTCPGGSLTTTLTLPASLDSTDQVSYELDGVPRLTQSLPAFGMAKQADGTWYVTKAQTIDCSIGAGAHTERFLDPGGKVLAQGSFTVVMGPGQSASPTSTAKPTLVPASSATQNPTPKQTLNPTPKQTLNPTPTPATGSSMTIQPSSFSCGGSPVDVTLTVVLDASISGSTMVSAVDDGTPGSSESVDSEFQKQSDGSWQISSTDTSTNLCKQYPVGKHTLGIQYATGQLIAEGSFTVLP